VYKTQIHKTMADLDDGIQLNITPYQRKEKKIAPKQNNNKVNEKNDNDAYSVNEWTKPLKKNKDDSQRNPKNPKKKSNYIDPKDFVHVSSLFNKNPEIPTHSTKPDMPVKSDIATFTSDLIDDLPVNVRIRENLKQLFNFKTLTTIQRLAIPKVLNSHDVMIKSLTGSGKTMCYAIPMVEMLCKIEPTVKRSDGTFALILVPTRELANQTFDVVQLLCKSFINIVPGLLIGGEKCKSEKARLRKGVNIIVATPGRFQYHLKETQCLDLSRLSFLVLDEADRILDLGCEKMINDILAELNKRANVERQSILLSATLNNHIHNLAAVSLKNPIFIDALVESAKMKSESNDQYTTPSSLAQYYIICPAKLRLVTLLSFAYSTFVIKKGKMIIFVSNKNSVIFLVGVMKKLLGSHYGCSEDVVKSTLMLHGDMDQADRTKTFEAFKKFESAVLFTTDVAARGLDIPKVNWIIQYSCPTQTEDYLHRVGRTARIGEKGKSLLFLLPSEIDYLTELEAQELAISEQKIDDVLKESLMITQVKGKSANRKRNIEDEATKLQKFIEEEIILKSKEFHELSTSSFHSYIKSYATYPSAMKKVFHVKHLHLGHLAKSFGLREAPTQMTNIKFVGPTKNEEKERMLKIANSMKRKAPVSEENEIFSGPKTKKFRNLKQKKKNNKKIRI